MNRPPKSPTMPDALPLEIRAAPVEAIDLERRTVDVVWTAGAQVERYDWFSDQRYVEELVVSDKAIRMDRFSAGAVQLLDNHRMYGSVTDVLGTVERAWIEKGKGLATIRFPKEGATEAADRAFALVSDRIIRSISVGYKRHRIEVDKTGKLPVWRVVDWEPFEISLVNVPADMSAQVRRENAETFACEFVNSTQGASIAGAARMRMRQRLNDMAG